MGCCFTCPEQETLVFVETCGKFSHIAYPGCNCLHCYCGQYAAGKISLRVQQLDVRIETKTRDNVFVTLVISVQYQVQKAEAFEAFYKLTDSKQQISSFVFDVVRATVPRMDLDSVFIEKEEVAREVKEQLTKAMYGFGYTILNALVNDIEPAKIVKDAMNEINAATRLRIAAVEKAEAQKIAVVKNAEADAESKYLAGMGIARQRQAIVNGLRDSVGGFREAVPDVTPQSVLELMMITQYFDMMRDIGASNKNSTVFLNSGPGAVADISQQIRTGMMQAGSAQEMSRVLKVE